jgi:oxygen-independent coproporphyrinogen-3 oxidase
VAGVRTLSLGIQAFDHDALAFLGRRHDGAAGRRAVAVAREAGFPTLSIDLIYGLPGQSLDDWRREIDTAAGLEPDHVSCYQLTIHRRTRFELLARRGELVPLDDEGQGAFFREAHRRLPAAGYAGYEVSQFARAAEHRSPHNVKYWDHTPYLGLGPSAHSFDGTDRWWNLRRTDPWQEAVRRGERPVEGRETLSREALVLESLMTGLRTYDGVDLERLERLRGCDLAGANEALIGELTRQGLLVREAERLRPTLEGLAVADRLAAMFELGG